MIHMHNIVKTFTGLERPVLTIAELSLKQGDFCVLIGANGSGKSTLLRLIAQHYFPDQGSLKVPNKVTQVTQNIHQGTFGHLSVFENIVSSLIEPPRMNLYKRYKNQVTEQLKEFGMGLERLIDQPMQCLSGGQRQLIATLMAFNSDAPVILLDEHTAALDYTMQKILMSYTERMIKQSNKTALMVTHNMHDALAYGNRLIMLDQGKIVWDIQATQKKSLNAIQLFEEFTQRAYADLKEQVYE